MPALSIRRVDVRDLDAELHEPFGIATGAQTRAENLLVTVILADGTEGYGEAAPFPAVNGETRAIAREAVLRSAPKLVGKDARAWRPISRELADTLPGVGSARCALETAVLDALCKASSMPLWAFFGGDGTSLETDVTITTGTADAAATSARRWADRGFGVLKVKVGGVPRETDLARLRSIVSAAPGCALLLDGNASLGTASEALALLDGVRRLGAAVVLFEQPLGKADHAGMREVAMHAGCPVAADEGVASVGDVVAVARERSAQVVNLKATKSGLVGALDMAVTARSLGLGLMIGAMVETPLALTASACLAAGLGGFSFVDLDTHLWMVDPPVVGGFAQRGPALDLADVTAGHGVRPR